MVKALRASEPERRPRKAQGAAVRVHDRRGSRVEEALVEYGDIDLGPLESVRVFPVLYIFMDLDLKQR